MLHTQVGFVICYEDKTIPLVREVGGGRSILYCNNMLHYAILYNAILDYTILYYAILLVRGGRVTTDFGGTRIAQPSTRRDFVYVWKALHMPCHIAAIAQQSSFWTCSLQGESFKR
jgi:hypothetical protein